MENRSHKSAADAETNARATRRTRRKKRHRSSGGSVSPPAERAAPDVEQPGQEEAVAHGFLEPELIEGGRLANDDIERS